MQAGMKIGQGMEMVKASKEWGEWKDGLGVGETGRGRERLGETGRDRERVGGGDGDRLGSSISYYGKAGILRLARDMVK